MAKKKEEVKGITQEGKKALINMSIAVAICLAVIFVLMFVYELFA